MISEILEKLSSHIDLEENEANDVMHTVMNGDLTSAQMAGLLMGLKMKGETVGEITGFVRAMRDMATKIKGPGDLIDTCGTGGDGAYTFNISTAAAIVASAADVPVAKHGNRSVSSKCGSADVLQELGVKIDLPPSQAEACLQQVGIAFLFAPVYHTSMKHVAEPRREMGIRTVFNILGPMSNPAQAKRQIIGAFDLETAHKMIQVLKNTGSEHVLLVHSEDGLDEISLGAATHINELKDGEIMYYKIQPEEVGLSKSSVSSIKGADPAVNSNSIQNVLNGDKSPYLDITALNAGAAIYVGGKSESIKQGVEIAFDTIQSGKAKNKLNDLIEFTNSYAVNA
jgi:anthranilate phosphoribosyltransferase